MSEEELDRLAFFVNETDIALENVRLRNKWKRENWLSTGLPPPGEDLSDNPLAKKVSTR